MSRAIPKGVPVESGRYTDLDLRNFPEVPGLGWPYVMTVTVPEPDLRLGEVDRLEPQPQPQVEVGYQSRPGAAVRFVTYGPGEDRPLADLPTGLRLLADRHITRA